MKQLSYSKTFIALALVLLMIFAPLDSLRAQSFSPQPAFEGKYVATDYNYGGQNGPNSLTVDTGGTGTGSQSYTLRVNAEIFLPRVGGRKFMPLATNAPILFDTEVVTPSAVSCTSPEQPGTCTITVTVANVHGSGSHISSGTFGLQEAINDASQSGGGRVQVDPLWAKLAGTATNQQQILSGTHATAPISFALNATFEPNSAIVEDIRGGQLSYWYATPGLTRITTPTALTKAGGAAATLTTAVTGGSIATATTPRITITAVDQFGGETAAADDSSANTALVDGAGSTNSYTITALGVPTGTGIVGYRVYVSATAGTTQTETLEPAANLVCAAAPLSPLPGTCGAGAAILITALPATTAAGPPPGTAGVATALSSAHTTVVNKQSGTLPVMLPFADTFGAGSFPVTVTSATTLVVGFDVMGEIQYPAGLFNVQGATFRICGGGVTTPSAATVAGTMNIHIGPRENSAGTSTEVVVVPFSFVASTLFTAALNAFDFCTDVTVTTAGTSGVLEAHGSVFCAAPTAGNPAGVTGCETAFNAASTAQDLTQQGVIELSYFQSAASWTLPQLRYFSIRRI